MPSARTAPVLVVIAVCFFVCSCVEDRDYGQATNLRPDVNRNVEVNANANIANDSEIALDEIINLPFEPEESIFREIAISEDASNRVPGPKDKRLTVVLSFSEEDTRSILENARTVKPPFETEVEAEPWFPAELLAKSETSGNQQLKGMGYSAKEFTKSPWLNGSLIRIDETRYFVLILQTT